MSAFPFVILPTMFAIKRDGEPHIIIFGEEGSHSLKSPESLDGWAKLYARQSEAVRQSAIAGSMFGWDAAYASLARQWRDQANDKVLADGRYEVVS